MASAARRATPAQRATLRAEHASQRRVVDALAETDLRALLRILGTAQTELALKMREWVAAHPGDGELRWTAQSYRNAIAQIDELQRQISRRTFGVASARDTTLIRGGIASVNEDLARLSSHFAGSVRPIAVRQAAAVASGRAYLTGRFRTSAARYAGHIGEDLRKRLAMDLIKGAPLRDTVAELVRSGGPRGLVALRGVAGEPGSQVEHIAEGLFRRYPHWADRWVRTEYANAHGVVQTIATRDIADQLGPGTVSRVWIAAPRCCREICYNLDGLICDAHGLFLSPDLGPIEAPPAHPYCRCTTAVYAVAWDQVDWRRFEAAA